MADQPWLLPDEQRAPDLSQWYTPPWLAERIIAWADIPAGARVLEPAAGQGAFIRPNRGEQTWTAYDVDPKNIDALRHIKGIEEADGKDTLVHVAQADFLGADVRDHDIAVLNPPYENNQDVDFVLKCLRHAPRVIALLRSAFLHGQNRYDEVWRAVQLSRLVILCGRPKFGGSGSPKSDFIVVELCNPHMMSIGRGVSRKTTIEWW